jgi:hypothetical protein
MFKKNEKIFVYYYTFIFSCIGAHGLNDLFCFKMMMHLIKYCVQ